MLTVQDLMTKDPMSVQLDAPLRSIVEIMQTRQCRQVPVLDENNRLAGIVTDRDVRLAMKPPLILHERWEEERLLDSLPAAACMTSNVVTVSSDTPAHEAAKILVEKKFGALPVVDGDHLVGILTVSDILNKFIELIETN